MKRLKFIPICLLFCFYLQAQTKFNAKFTTEDEYGVDRIVKTSNGHYFGFSFGGSTQRSFYYVFNNKLKNTDRHWLNHQYGRPLGFYVGPKEAILALADKAYLHKLTYNYAEQKVTETKPKFPATTNDYDNLSLFVMENKTLYYLNASSMGNIATGKAWFSGRKYNFISETMEAEFENKDDKHKVTEHIDQRVFFLKNGNILLFVKENKGKPNGISFRPDGFSIYLYDNDLNLLSSKTVKNELWYDCNKGLSLLSNSNEISTLYLWARKVESNKMSLFKINIEGEKIEIKENRIKDKEVETSLINENIDSKGYDEILKFLITEMPEDKYQENPGTSYYIDSTYVLGENTYINYNIFQSVKGNLKGEIYMCGVFVLNNEGILTKNIAVDLAFNDEKKKKDKNQLDNGVRQLYPFFNKNKIVYAYTRNLKLMGFEIEADKEIVILDDVKIAIPKIDKDVLPWKTFYIIPMSNESFLLKAVHQKTYRDIGAFTYEKCDYTLFNIE